MLSENVNMKLSGVTADLARLKSEISTLIEEELSTGLCPRNIADNIFSKIIVDHELVVEESKSSERPVSINEIVFIAKKAVKQADFEGVHVVLPTGEMIRMRKEGAC